MFVNKLSHILRGHITKSKRCFNEKSSTHYFHVKTKILPDFQICISVPLRGITAKTPWQFLLPKLSTFF